MEDILDRLPAKFVENMRVLLGNDYEKYEEALKSEAVRGLRVNTKRISVADFLRSTNLSLEKLNFCDDGFVLKDNDKLGNTPEHLSGLFYLQEPSSMVPVAASGIEKESRPLKVLDLCSSPGGKTGQIAMRVSDDSVIFSNEIISQRAQVLYQNIERQGLKNVVALNEKPENLLVFENYFDYVFVDAPCSGEGMFRKNPETIAEWNENVNDMCAARQKDILRVAQKLVKPNGKLVYSTCTFSEKEDEEIVRFLVDEFGFKLLDVPNEIKKVTISAKGLGCDFARRFLPYSGEGEGQFVAVLKKNDGDGEGNLYSKKHFKSVYEIGQNYNKVFKVFEEENLTEVFNWKDLVVVGDTIYKVPVGFDGKIQTALDELKFVSIGVKLGEVLKGRFEPNHNMFMAFDGLFKNKFELDNESLKKYLHGEEIIVDTRAKGYGVVTKNGFPLGGVKIAGGRLKNLYPKGLRI